MSPRGADFVGIFEIKRSRVRMESNLPVTESSDAALLATALGGDELAFAQLFRRRQGEIFRFALQMTGQEAAAEDIVQETFLVLLNSEVGSRYDAARGPLRAFLYGVARKLVLRHLERGEGARGWRAQSEEETGERAGPEDVLGDLTRRETVEQVRQAVLSLPTAYREAVVLCDLQETSYEEAAAALGCPVGTVRSRLNRGRKLLAQKLGAGGSPATGRGSASGGGAPGLQAFPAALRSIE